MNRRIRHHFFCFFAGGLVSCSGSGESSCAAAAAAAAVSLSGGAEAPPPAPALPFLRFPPAVERLQSMRVNVGYIANLEHC